jgi:DNA-binding NtrC family response regulator
MYTATNANVLLVDDEPSALRVLSAILREEGYNILESTDGENAVRIMEREDVDAVITDMKMPGMDGMQVFEYVSERHPDVPVIFLTAYGTIESAVSAVARGAFNYLVKPPDYLNLKLVLGNAVEQRRFKRELDALRGRLAERDGYRIIGKTPGMVAIFDTINAVKNSSSSVLITGETGTGKELIAKALHGWSQRNDKPFVTVNCTAIPRELLESELFGYEKGAFTGAVSRRVGKFEAAGDGVVFLDEIGELEPALQAKLLRVLQEREVERLGGNAKVRVNFRLVCSTNRELEREVKAGNFRSDLFYRINVVGIKVPPLRERRDDIPLLVSEFMKELCILEPGNIRQLRNVVERAVVLARGKKITMAELPEELQSFRRGTKAGSSVGTLRELELQAVRDALNASKNNKSRAAKMLGISRKALYKRLKELSVSSELDCIDEIQHDSE